LWGGGWNARFLGKCRRRALGTTVAYPGHEDGHKIADPAWQPFEKERSMSAREEIQTKVAKVLVEALNVDEEEVTPASTLQGDLGAESIDMLDIVFRLEREFGIKIPRGELFPESIFQGDPEFVRDGKVTDEGMRELRFRMPFADLGAVEHDRRLSAVPDLFTVGLVTRYVAWKLGPGAGTSPDDRGAIPTNGAHQLNPTTGGKL
jgi:acyl carrier protein